MLDTTIQWYPGHMAKAKKMIKEHLTLVDVTLEVVDARIPRASRNPDFESIISRKPRVIVLNKKDLADEGTTRAWIAYYQSQGIGAVAINAASKQNIKELAAAAKLAAEPTLRALEAKGRRRRPVRVMVIGIPNVGKSTVINALVDKASTKTGDRPGITKGTQWVRAVEGLELLDTPGLLWPKFDDQEDGFRLAATGAISDAVFPLQEVAKELLRYLGQMRPQALEDRYKVGAPFEDAEQYLELIGRKRGHLAPGNIVRIEQTALVVLQEFRSGQLGRITLEKPPAIAEK